MREKIVCVEWDDACFDSGYYDKGNPKRYEQLETKTVGLVIKTTPKEIIVGTDTWLNNDGKTEYRHISTIPKKMIRKIVYLEARDASKD